MIPPVIVLRPEPGCAPTLAAAKALGLDAWGFPLFEVAPLAWEPVPENAIDALLIGSANVLRHAGPALARYRHLPAYVVGETTAAAAREAGFAIAATGSGGLAAVLGELAPGHRRLLRLAGRERVELVPPDGISLIEREVYASMPQAMPRALVRLLRTMAIPRFVVLLHSAEAARHFAAQCDDNGIARERIALATLGPRIAAAAGSGWASLDTAVRPDDAALLALASQLCQNPGGCGGAARTDG